MTKLQKILKRNEMSQGDLLRAIYHTSGFQMGRDRISKIVNGTLTNYTVETAVMIAEALDVTVNDIIEIKDVKKQNFIQQHYPTKMGGGEVWIPKSKKN